MSDTGTVVRGHLLQIICWQAGIPEAVLLLAEHPMAMKHRKALHWFSSFSKVLIWSILFLSGGKTPNGLFFELHYTETVAIGLQK